MKRIAICLGATLALAACSSEEQQLENSIRENLSSRGNVTEVDLAKQDDNHLTGHAVVNANGQNSRLNCTAERTGGKGANFSWRCVPAIDEAALNEMENTIRQSYASRATVGEVEMRRQDDDHMTGFATLTDGQGNAARVDCTAERVPEGNFSWRCNPAGQSGAAAGGDGDK